MKLLTIAAGATLFVATLAGFSQSVRCGQSLNAPLRRGAQLTIDSLSSGIEIVGTDQETIHVSCRADDPETANDIRIQLSGSADHAKLTIKGDHLNHNNLHLRIEVPRRLDVAFHMAAGDVKIDEIEGNKDIQLTAGQISITAAHDWDYKDVTASVDIGAVNASAYGVNKGGFFRAFRKQDGHGTYRLRAHIMTGQIDLLGKDFSHTSSE